MVKDKDYYTKPIFPDSCYTQCLWDLAGGEIKIYDIPFEYREGVSYVLARKALRYEVFGEDTQHEKTLLMECLKNDIIKCEKEKKDPSGQFAQDDELNDREGNLLSLFELSLEENYIPVSISDIKYGYKNGNRALFKKLYGFY